MNQEKTYDFVIVGSGIGGLVSAVVLGKHGHSVLVLEKNHQIGGSLQVFSRDKRVFDTGVHYIGGLDKGENLHAIFSYLGIMDALKIQRLDDHCFDRILFPDGTSFELAQGYDRFIESLKSQFPGEEVAIEAYCEKLRSVCDFFPLYNLEDDAQSEKSYVSHPEILAESAWGFLDTITDNERLKNVLVGNGLLYAGDRKTTPMYMVALIMNSYMMGSYRMVNGGSQIARELTRRIHELGGKVVKHQEVVSAEYEGESVHSVRTKTGDIFYGKHFISNLHPRLTVKIFGEQNFRAAYRHRLARLQNTVSSFMLYLSLKDGYIPYINHNIYAYGQDEVWETVDYKEAGWPQAMFICTPVSSKTGEFADSISVMAYMDYSEVAHWGDTFNTVAVSGDRGEAYEEFKKRKEEEVIDKLAKIFPRIREAIEGVYSSTPLTYKDYIGTEDGSLYGIMKDYNNSMLSKLNVKTRVPNLYQTGQNMVFHGILGATIGALVTCFQFVESKELIEQIKKESNGTRV
jgi:all-trans-retinol 13,14-reductase